MDASLTTRMFHVFSVLAKNGAAFGGGDLVWPDPDGTVFQMLSDLGRKIVSSWHEVTLSRPVVLTCTCNGCASNPVEHYALRFRQNGYYNVLIRPMKEPFYTLGGFMEHGRQMLEGVAPPPHLERCPWRSLDVRYSHFESDQRVAAACNAQYELVAYNTNRRLGNECYVPSPIWEVIKERV